MPSYELPTCFTRYTRPTHTGTPPWSSPDLLDWTPETSPLLPWRTLVYWCLLMDQTLQNCQSTPWFLSCLMSNGLWGQGSYREFNKAALNLASDPEDLNPTGSNSVTLPHYDGNGWNCRDYFTNILWQILEQNTGHKTGKGRIKFTHGWKICFFRALFTVSWCSEHLRIFFIIMHMLQPLSTITHAAQGIPPGRSPSQWLTIGTYYQHKCIKSISSVWHFGWYW